MLNICLEQNLSTHSNETELHHSSSFCAGGVNFIVIQHRCYPFFQTRPSFTKAFPSASPVIQQKFLLHAPSFRNETTCGHQSIPTSESIRIPVPANVKPGNINRRHSQTRIKLTWTLQLQVKDYPGPPEL